MGRTSNKRPNMEDSQEPQPPQPFQPATGNPRKQLASAAARASYTPEGTPPKDDKEEYDTEDEVIDDDEDEYQIDQEERETSFRGTMQVGRYLVGKDEKPVVKVTILDQSGNKMGTLKGKLLLKEEAHIWRDGMLSAETRISLEDDVDSDDDIQPEPDKKKGKEPEKEKEPKKAKK